MLVLTRRVDESIMIGDDVRIVVVDVRGDQVKLGIEAPRAIPVHREEVYREIQEENRRAALANDQPAGEDGLDRLSKVIGNAGHAGHSGQPGHPGDPSPTAEDGASVPTP